MLLRCYNVLNKIYIEGAYSGIALNSELEKSGADKPAITKIVYGVIEKEFLLNYYISKLCQKKPKPAVVIIIKIGLYQLLFTDNKQYAIVNNTVELAKRIGKPVYGGFINAVLKNFKSVELPKPESDLYYSVKYNYPLWFLEKIKEDYPDCFLKIISYEDDNKLTHVRANTRKTTYEDLGKLIEQISGIALVDTIYGYYVTHNILDKLPEDIYTVQSLGSIIVADCLKTKENGLILDVCAAPGGKSVYLSERNQNLKIVSCDLHPHRVRLIESYIKRMGADNIIPVIQDASVFHAAEADKYDAILCDAPCSGSGVTSSKPDIMLNRKKEDIIKLTEIQSAILNNVSKYLKIGGYLLYSTCSIFKDENEKIADNFLKNNPDFISIDFEIKIESLKIGNYKQLLPYLSKTEGFFIALFKRIS